jgi:hypothetical protein
VGIVTWMGSQPSLDRRVLMGRLIVDLQMDIQVSRHIGVHLFEKLEIFLMTVSILT